MLQFVSDREIPVTQVETASRGFQETKKDITARAHCITVAFTKHLHSSHCGCIPNGKIQKLSGLRIMWLGLAIVKATTKH